MPSVTPESFRFWPHVVIVTFLVFLLSWIVGLQSSLSNPGTSPCLQIELLITAWASNKILRGDPRVATSSLENFLAFASQDNGVEMINETYTIRGWKCSPNVSHHKYKKPLLFFVHGVSYTSTYWSGLADPSQPGETSHSWVNFALRRGFEVLVIDRLGHGASDIPDPLRVVQLNYQAAGLATLLNQVRQTHDFIGYVGHSYGSVIGMQIAASHPSLPIDAYILTGLAQPSPAVAEGQFNGNFRSASDAFPLRFPSKTFGPGYILWTNLTCREESFYSAPGEFDHQLMERDHQSSAATTMGEVASQDFSVANEYTGAVFVMTGQKDATLCGTRVREGAFCGENGEENQVTRLLDHNFPNARNKGSYLQPLAGHSLLLHHSWELGVSKAHEFLDGL